MSMFALEESVPTGINDATSASSFKESRRSSRRNMTDNRPKPRLREPWDDEPRGCVRGCTCEDCEAQIDWQIEHR
jgi:hypothetical protein